jgi:hypothetical protein
MMGHPKRILPLVLALAWVFTISLTHAPASWGQGKDAEFCSLAIAVASSKDQTPIVGAEVVIKSYSQSAAAQDEEWTSCHTIELTTDDKGKAYTDAVGLTGSACEVRATAKKGMIYRCDITVSAEGFQEALQKTFFDCKNPHPETSFHLSPQ